MTTSTRTRWGRARSGRGGLHLWGPAVLIGAVLSGAVATVAVLLDPSGRGPLLGWVVVACTLPVGTAAGWAILVDRSSLVGATERPAESVESTWYAAAAAGAFHDAIAIVGLGAAALALTAIDIAGDVLLMGLWVLLALDLAIRYRVLSRTKA